MRMPRTATRPGPMHTPDALQAGARLGECQIERLLQAGGFSLGYLASDQARKRMVAIEEFLPSLLASRAADGLQVVLRQPAHAEAYERGLQAFLAEVDLLARCVHPALPRIERRWRANGTAYREMLYAPATRLRRLRQGMSEPPDEDALRSLLEGVLGALDVLHASGHVHGAISPDTILLRDADDSPLLLGFDAAQRAIVGGQAQALMRAIGAGYAPLDRSDAGDPGPWADLYALASVMRFCIDGDGADAGTPMANAVRRADPYPQLMYSEPFVAAIDWALAARPQDRPQSVAQFRAALLRRGRGGSAWARGADEPSQATVPIDATVPLASLASPSMAASSAFEAPGHAAVPKVAAPPVIDFPPHVADDLRAERWDADPREGRGEGAAPASERRHLGVWAGGAALVAAVVFAGWQIQQQWRNNTAERGLARVTEGTLPMTVTGPASTAHLPARTAMPTDPATLTETQPPAAGVAQPPPTVPLPEPVTQASTPAPVAAPAITPALAPAPVVSTEPPAVPATGGRSAAPAATPRAPQGEAGAPEDPRAACAPRTQFSLYRCMQTQCAKRQWREHPQCVRLREDDQVG